MHRFEGEGDGTIAQVRYVDGRVWINSSQYFTDVPVEVCEKWLKDRRGETLSRSELQQYRAILLAVAETLRVMAAIDGVLW